MAKKYSLPFRSSENIKISPAPYHKEAGNMKHCVDFSMPEGTPVLAAREGIVVGSESRFNKSYSSPKYADRCNRIIIVHADGEESVCVHLEWHSLKVKIGEFVKTGQLLGLSGQTGYATYPHLHFGVYDKNGKNIKIKFNKI